MNGQRQSSRWPVRVSEKCADRELNPGRELGKLESYHVTIGALGVCE